jgi:two-component system, OmpR family, response regulator MtrA
LATQLVVLAVEGLRSLRSIQDLVRGGAVVILAPTLDEARKWVIDSIGKAHTSPSTHESLRLGKLVLDRTSHSATWNERELHLTEREFQLLGTLAEVPGRAWSFGELANRVWGVAYLGHRGAIQAAVKRLRKKLRAEGVRLSIEPVRGVGFRIADRCVT